jgi:uncharacterized membrane protein
MSIAVFSVAHDHAPHRIRRVLMTSNDSVPGNTDMSEGSVEGVITIVRQLVEWVALSIQVLAVLVIVGALVAATMPRGVFRTRVGAGQLDPFSSYKQRMGRGLLLGLELLLTADIIDTVALKPTLESLAALGLLALIRSFLSWSLEVEIEGQWPWRAKAEAARSGAKETTPAPAPGN